MRYLHRQALVAREQGVPAEEAPGDELTFDVCVRTPYVFEYTNGSRELMTATEASRLLPGNPSLQIDMPQAPAPVIQLDVLMLGILFSRPFSRRDHGAKSFKRRALSSS